jgi:hypothetical protein
MVEMSLEMNHLFPILICAPPAQAQSWLKTDLIRDL